jgi:hypothetical protein
MNASLLRNNGQGIELSSNSFAYNPMDESKGEISIVSLLLFSKRIVTYGLGTIGLVLVESFVSGSS